MPNNPSGSIDRKKSEMTKFANKIDQNFINTAKNEIQKIVESWYDEITDKSKNIKQ